MKLRIVGFPGLIFLAGLLGSIFAGHAVKSAIDGQARRQFAFDCEEIRLKIEARMQAHRQVLLGAAALFDASDAVNRKEWAIYARRLEIDQHFNGIQGLGFAVLIPKEKLASHIAEVRREGFPDYKVWPEGGREIYSPVIFLEPFSGRNLRAFGYDMYAEPVRREAMDKAWEEGGVTLSSRVVLVQETGQDVQAGTLMYAPVYRKATPLDTVEQRRAALLGWVYSPFRMGDLLQGVLGNWNGSHLKQMRLRVYDGGGEDAASLLYDSEPPPSGAASAAVVLRLNLLTSFGRRDWSLRFEQTGERADMDYGKAWAVMAGGLTASLLLSLLSLSLLDTRRRARVIAAELTAEVRARSVTEAALLARLHLQDAALKAAANAIIITNPGAVIEWANPAFTQLTGHSLKECVGKNPWPLIKSGLQDAEFYASLWQTILSGLPWHGELVNRRKDGTFYHEEMTITPVPDEQGKIAHFVAVKQDISARKQTEEKLRELNRDFVAFLENTSDFVYFMDQDQRFRFCSQAMAKVTGHADWREIVGRHVLEQFPPDAAQVYFDDNLAIFRDGKPLLNCIMPYYDEAGRKGWASTNKWPLFSSDGQAVIGIFGISRDTTELLSMERQLKAREALFRGFFEQSILLAGILDEEGRVLEVNDTALGIIGAEASEVIGQYFPDTPWWQQSPDRNKLTKALQTARAGRPSSFEAVHSKADGGAIKVIFNAVPIVMDDGLRVAVTGVDVTSRWLAEMALRETESRFHTMADHAPVLIWTAGLDKLCDYFNKVWLDFTGRSIEQEIGNGWAEGVHPNDFQRCLDTYVAAFDARQEFTMEYRLRRHDGEYRWITDHGVPRFDGQGNFVGYIGSCIDITERHEMEELVRQLAFYDPLTKLANRRLLGDRLIQTIAANKRKGLYGALMFLDLDNFKPLNDQHGHAAGDLLLAEVAGRLAGCVREMDTAARFGGDEFVVLLAELDADMAEATARARRVAEKLRQALAEPYVLALPQADGGPASIIHYCSGSIGLAVFGPLQPNAEEILKRADAAMYHAKKAGRNAICLGNPEGGFARV